MGRVLLAKFEHSPVLKILKILNIIMHLYRLIFIIFLFIIRTRHMKNYKNYTYILRMTENNIIIVTCYNNICYPTYNY